MSKVDYKSRLSQTLKQSASAEQQRFAPTPEPPKRPSVAELAARVDGKLEKPPAPAAVAKPKAPPAPARRSKPTLDSYSCTKEDLQRLQGLVQRALKVGTPTNKSEVIRAGLIALAELPNAEFSRMLLKVPRLKTGRPAAAAKSK
mgnify:CR=1 FL=1